MNVIVKKKLLAGDKFVAEMHLKQPVLLNKSGFTYSDLLIVLVDLLLEIKKELSNLRKQKI